MDPAHVQPVQSLTPDPRSRARTLVAVALPVALLVGFVAAGVLGRAGEPPPPRLVAAAETTPPRQPSMPPDTVPERPTPGPALAGVPTNTLGLTVRTIEEILDLRASGRIGSEVVAVSGWLTIPRLGQCPGAPGLELETADPGLVCQRETWLADEALPIFAIEHKDGLVTLRDPGRHLRPQAVPGVELASVVGRQFMGNSIELRPRRVVIAGRFGDPRLEECRPPGSTCAETFAIERLIWMDGEAQRRRTERYPGLDDTQLSRKVRWHIVDGATQPGAVILSEILLPRSQLGTIDPIADRVVPTSVAGTVWYVRTLLRSGPHGRATGDIGWAVIEDATATVLAAHPDARTSRAE